MHGDDRQTLTQRERLRRLPVVNPREAERRSRVRPSLWQRYNRHLVLNTSVLILAALTAYFAVVRYEIVETVADWLLGTAESVKG